MLFWFVGVPVARALGVGGCDGVSVVAWVSVLIGRWMTVGVE